MARTSTYLNFGDQTEAAFKFYKQVFGGEFITPIQRFGDSPATSEGIDEKTKNLVLHVALAITGGHVIMGSDMPESMGFLPNHGNTMHLNLEPDTRTEADRLFTALSVGGKIHMPMQEMFWGAYWGSFADQFGTNWMINCESK